MRRFDGNNAGLLAILAATSMLGGCLSGGGSGDEAPAAEPVAVDNNHAPTIAGKPQDCAMPQSTYEFTPEAADPDNDALTFSVSSKPAWASFSAQNGKLSGTPTEADAGTYENIKITVSDGKASASLGGFSITVSQSANGSLTLNWTPPTTNADGSTLMDLAGYYVYFGTKPHEYPYEIYLDNEGLTSYVVEGLCPNSYNFALTAVNSKGLESDLSNVVTFDVT